MDMETYTSPVAAPIAIHERKPLILDHEKEKASNSYLMSLLAIMAGLPLPIINLIATMIFFLANRKESYFVRWHCTQALLQQLTVLLMNSVGFAWTMKVLFNGREITNQYIAYMATIICFNLIEFVLTMIAAVQVRKGVDVRWWFWADMTDVMMRRR
jgi:uncharacterized Tic20 family protein